ncbi:hypothetical protein WJX84_012025 [Apatococcus fuscideae]|uniref:BZIP domain-containing protein n=1 Tax=Apatococcus fuscideae TaxID=2026836 RepID=A0AAW1STP5_9CHLO
MQNHEAAASVCEAEIFGDLADLADLNPVPASCQTSSLLHSIHYPSLNTGTCQRLSKAPSTPVASTADQDTHHRQECLGKHNRGGSLPAASAKQLQRAESKSERNKRAQSAFRERQKVRRDKHSNELAEAVAQISQLGQRVADLELLLSGELQHFGVEMKHGEASSMLAQVCTSRAALQLERTLLLSKEFQLNCLSQLLRDGGGLCSSMASTTSALRSGPDDCNLAWPELLQSKCLQIQTIKPSSAWASCTPVPVEQLYTCILEGRLDIHIPLATDQAPEKAVVLRTLVAMPAELHLQMQAQYHATIAKAAHFCGNHESVHRKHLEAAMGEATVLLAVFSKCLPKQFLASQSVSWIDGSTRMPPEAFENLKVAASAMAAASTATSFLPELRGPHHAAYISADVERLSGSYILQMQAYMDLSWALVLSVLTPFQAGMLSAASYPYMVEFPAIMWHMLHSATESVSSHGDGSEG